MTIRKGIIISLFFAAAAAFSLAPAHADTATGTTSSSSGAAAPEIAPIVNTCAPSAADLKQISAIQNDPTLTYTDEIKQELALRKKLLGQTIACAKDDVGSVRAALNAVPANGDASNVKAQLSSKLDDATNFYNIELSKLDGVGISGSEAIAKEILAYRMGSYYPLAGNANNFVLWSGNQGLFSVAQTRMNQTIQAVSFLESATPDTDLESALAAARTSFQNAQDANHAAYSALAQSLPPEQSLGLIQQSLSSLADTYQRFSTVSDLIKSLLPQ